MTVDTIYGTERNEKHRKGEMGESRGRNHRDLLIRANNNWTRSLIIIKVVMESAGRDLECSNELQRNKSMFAKQRYSEHSNIKKSSTPSF